MPTVSFIHTEINPGHSEGSGGGRRTFVETEVMPIPAEGAGGGRRIFVLEGIPPILSLPLPEVITGPATEIGLVEANINGFLEEDGGILCDCAFEWGLTDSYGNITPPQTKAAGEHFSQLLTGLQPDTSYHYRALASNVFGLSHGIDRIFRTLSVMPPPYFQGPLISLLEEDTL